MAQNSQQASTFSSSYSRRQGHAEVATGSGQPAPFQTDPPSFSVQYQYSLPWDQGPLPVTEVDQVRPAKSSAQRQMAHLAPPSLF